MRSQSVLLVDDDRDLRSAVALVLEAEGHVVRQAEHGRHALITIARAPPHLIILDLKMPVMDGRAFLEQKARSEHAAIPVVIFSSTPPEDVESLPGVVSVVHKLSGVDALLDAVKHAAQGLARDARSLS